MEAEKKRLWAVRDMNRNLIAITEDEGRARKIRTILYTRDSRFSNVMPFKARNKMEQGMKDKFKVV